MPDIEISPEVIRKNVEYQNLSEKYKPPQESLNKQYYHIYKTRISIMKKMLLERIKLKWGNSYPVCKLGEIRNQQGNECIIIGTIFKDQQLKPSLLKELCEENQLIPQPHRTHFTEDSDQIILEDELQRINLYGKLNVHEIVTGVVCAVLGKDSGIGKFTIEDYAFVDCSAQIERMIVPEDRYVVFVSGLDLANDSCPLFSIELFVDWISGLLGDADYQTEVSNIVRLVIAGNSIRSSADTKNKKSLISRNVETDDTFEAMKKFDDYLERLTEVINVDIMPGEFDPSNYMLPQQPLHYCMFPKSNNLKTLNSVSNPYDFSIEGVRITGTSGQPVHEVERYSRLTDPLDMLEKILQWGHLCPTAPDTLACYPYYDSDPFVLTECPHVMFSGNQSQFSTKIYKGPENQRVRLLCIPEFHRTQTVVILNLKTLDCYPMYFKTIEKK